MKVILKRISAAINAGDWLLIASIIAALLGHSNLAVGFLLACFYVLLSGTYDRLNELVKLNKSQLNKE